MHQRAVEVDLAEELLDQGAELAGDDLLEEDHASEAASATRSVPLVGGDGGSGG